MSKAWSIQRSTTVEDSSLSPLALEPPGHKDGWDFPLQHGLLNGWRFLVLIPNVYFCIDHRSLGGTSFSSRWLLLHVMS